MSFSKLFKIFIVPLIIFVIPMVWYLKQSQKITWLDSQGQERIFFVPKITGIKLVGEKENKCYWRGLYESKTPSNPENFDKIKNLVKGIFVQNRWTVRAEKTADGVYGLELYNPDSKDLQTVTILVQPEQREKGERIMTYLLYQWPPCSEEYEPWAVIFGG